MARCYTSLKSRHNRRTLHKRIDTLSGESVKFITNKFQTAFVRDKN